jgi:hypothetical protein
MLIGISAALLMIFGIFFIPYAYYNPVKGFITGEYSQLDKEPILNYVFSHGYYPEFAMLAGYAAYYFGSMGVTAYFSYKEAKAS